MKVTTLGVQEIRPVAFSLFVYLAVKLLLKCRREVSGHLSYTVACRVSNSRMRVLKETDNSVDHLVQIGLHLLVCALGSRRQSHQTGISVLPVSVAKHAVNIRQNVWQHCFTTQSTG